MKFSLVFEKSGDTIPFTVIANEPLFEFFIATVNDKVQNSFSNKKRLANELNKKLTELHWAISKSNEVLYSLIGKSFEQQNTLEDYLNTKLFDYRKILYRNSQADNNASIIIT
jgi:hypothetical protein